MLLSRVAGSTSVILPVFLQDSSSSVGAGLAGLVFNTGSLTCYYKRSNGAAEVAVTLANITTLGTWETGGFKQWGATNSKGMYEFHPPNAAMASGAEWVVFFFRGAANLADTPILVDLKPVGANVVESTAAAGAALAAALLDLTDGIESGKTLRQALRAIASALAGNVTSSGGAYAAIGNSGTPRIAVTDGGSGNRTVTTSL